MQGGGGLHHALDMGPACLPACPISSTYMQRQLVLLMYMFPCMLGTLLNHNCHCYFPCLQLLALLTQVLFIHSTGERLMGKIWLWGWWFSFRGDGDKQLGQQVSPSLLCYVLMPGQLPQLVMLLCPQSGSHALLDPPLTYLLNKCHNLYLSEQETEAQGVKVVQSQCLQR